MIMEAARLRDLLVNPTSLASPDCIETAITALPEQMTGTVEVKVGPAAELLDVYTYRYNSVEGFRDAKTGWDQFLGILRRNTGRIGLAALSAGDQKFIILLDEELRRVLACLAPVARHSG